MGGFLIRKAGAALVVLVAASMLVFAGVRAIPGNPAIALGAENRDPTVLAAVRAQVRPQPAAADAVRALDLARGPAATSASTNASSRSGTRSRHGCRSRLELALAEHGHRDPRSASRRG